MARRHKLSNWMLTTLEDRTTPAAPSTPLIIEPFNENQITGTFDINIQTDPGSYSDPDGDTWESTDWLIRETSSGSTVWQLPFTSSPPLTFYRVDFSDGQFVGSLAGKTELNFSTNYQLVVRYRDSNNEVSLPAIRNFTTAAPTQPVPGAGTWLVRPGYTLDLMQTGMRLPVNIAFVPDAGPNPTDPLYFVNELYGSIQVVLRNGTRQTFASGLLDYNPQGPISGVGEQGLTGLAVERDSNNPDIYNLYVAMLWDNGAPPGAPNHYPKVERITSTVGGLTMATRTVLLNMQPETMGQSHIVSNVTFGPDDKLYVHVGDGFNSSTALNLDLYRGKILRMNKDGSPVATGDPAGANPFYDAGDGINARDYIYTYGHRNPFGGSWDPATGKHWIVENGNSLDRMTDLVAGTSYGWAGNDNALTTFSKFNWIPSTAPVNMDFVHPLRFGGSNFPTESQGSAFVALSGTTYAAGPLQRSKGIVEFTDLTTLNGSGKLAVEPSFLVKYNGSGRATPIALASGPDGLYFSDFYEDTGANGATAAGANVYRIRYVGNTGGLIPTVDTPAAASPDSVTSGNTTQLTVLGDDDGGEANLTYTWGLLGTPPAPVHYSVNATNAAKTTTATFTANGTYTFYVAIRDAGGQSAISTVNVTVTSVLTETGDGLNAQYWSNINFTGNTLTRVDPNINFNFGTGGPGGTIGTNTFSARWTGFIVPRYSETYTFATTSDDGARLWVGNTTGTPLVNAFFDQSGTQPYTGTITLVANTIYPILMEYYENVGDANVKLEWSSPSQPLEAVPQGRLYTVAPTAPLAPSALMLTSPTPNEIVLNWTDNANNEAGFAIERSTNGVNYTQISNTGSNLTTFSDTGLAAGTLYYYRVRAINPAGVSAFTMAQLPTRPSAPAGVNVVAGNGEVQVTWAFTPGATTYRLFRSTTSGDQNPPLLASGIGALEYLDTTVVNGQSYYYRLSAVNVGGESALSDENVAIPLLTSVTGITVNTGDAQRSRLDTITVTLADSVDTSIFQNPGAITLTRTQATAGGMVGTVVNTTSGLIVTPASGGSSILTLTFANTGNGVEFGSLADGYWQLAIPSMNYHSTLGSTQLRRLFGDIDNNGTVDGSTDFAAFGSVFGATVSTAFDFDLNGTVDSTDFAQFGARFGVTL